MPDYSACDSGDCEKKNSCARYRMVRKSSWQSVILPLEIGDECRMFWDVHEVTPFHLNPTEELTTM